MAFDFVKRAAEREQAEHDRQMAEGRAWQERVRVSQEMTNAFTRFAGSQRGLSNLRVNDDAPSATFGSGSREVKVEVLAPTTFRVTQSIVMSWGLEAPTTDPIDVEGEDALMDLLDAWARGQ